MDFLNLLQKIFKKTKQDVIKERKARIKADTELETSLTQKITQAINNFNKNLVKDNTPTYGSTNLITSGAVYNAISNKVEAIPGKQLSTYDFDSTYRWLLLELANQTTRTSLIYKSHEFDNGGGVVQAASPVTPLSELSYSSNQTHTATTEKITYYLHTVGVPSQNNPFLTLDYLSARLSAYVCKPSTLFEITHSYHDYNETNDKEPVIYNATDELANPKDTLYLNLYKLYQQRDINFYLGALHINIPKVNLKTFTEITSGSYHSNVTYYVQKESMSLENYNFPWIKGEDGQYYTQLTNLFATQELADELFGEGYSLQDFINDWESWYGLVYIASTTGATEQCNITFPTNKSGTVALTSDIDARANAITLASLNGIASSEKGAANGVATLDANGKVPSSQLPSYVDDVIEGYYYNGGFFETALNTGFLTGESGKIYVDRRTNKTYRWSGSQYTLISESLALGTTSGTACEGNDPRLTNSRPASDVYSWAKQPSKPSYNYSEIANAPTDLGDLTNNAGYTKNIGTVTGVKFGASGTVIDPSNGVVQLPEYPTSLPASDVSSWAKQASKPSYTATSTSTVTPTTIQLTFTYSDDTTETVTLMTGASVSTTTTVS